MWCAIVVLLLLPLVAMQLTSEVDWTAFDFAVAAALLGSAGAATEAAMRFISTPWKRTAALLAVGTATLLIWANGAVGLA